MQYIKKLVKSYRNISIFIVIMVTICNLLALLYNYSFKFVIDAIEVKNISLAFKYFIMVIFFQILVTVLTMLVYDYYLQVFQKKVERDVRRDIMKEILSWPYSNSRNIGPGNLSTLMTSDSEQIGQYVSLYDFMILSNTIRFIITYILLFTLDKLVGLIVLISVPFYYISTYFTLKPMRKFIKEGYEKRDQLNDNFLDLLKNLINIKSFHIEDITSNNIETKTNDLYTKEKSLQKWQAIFYFIRNFITSFMPVVILGISIIRIINNQMTIGSLVAIYGFLGAVYLPIGEIFQFKAMKNNLEPVIDRINPIVNSKFDKSDKRILNTGKTSIDIKNLTYAYGQNKVLDDLSITFEDKGLFRIRGENGVGKSTLFNIIAGLYNDFLGRVDIHLDQDHPNISYMNQKDILFETNIFDNISLFGKNNLNKFSKSLVDKFKLRDESMDSFSGGERRLFLFLRTINTDAAIYLFDEPFEGLDLGMKERVKEIINDLSKDRLVLIISHRDSDFDGLSYEEIFL
ncbi:MAG: ABC transporter ATP-binding protein [Anaerococcus sp.]|nr:ABC transporter ATP-binding protein [Anaerococcus sp.]